MVEKGLAQRDASQRTHVYAAAVERQTTERRLVGTLLDRAFRGSAPTVGRGPATVRAGGRRQGRQPARQIPERAADRSGRAHARLSLDFPSDPQQVAVSTIAPSASIEASQIFRKRLHSSLEMTRLVVDKQGGLC